MAGKAIGARPRRQWLMPAILVMVALLLGGVILVNQCLSRAPFVNHSPVPDYTATGPRSAESYRWRPVKIGGGGSITGIDFDQSGKTMVVRTDVHGAYIWNAGDDSWHQLFSAASVPAQFRTQAGMNQGAYEVAVAPSNPDRIYMAAMGHVLRSDDRGRNWQLPSGSAPFPFQFDPNSPYRFYGPFMAVSPLNPDIVFLGTPDRGLWRSLDGGRSWSQAEAVPVGKDMKAEPGLQTPGIAVWFGTKGALKGAVLAASPGHGMFVSSSTTGPFKPLGEAGYGPETIARGAFLDDGSFLAVDNESQRAWILRDGKWNDLSSSGLPPAAYVGIAVQGDRVMVSDGGGKLWCSGNRGESWSSVYHNQSAGPKDPPWLSVNSTGYFASGQMLFDPAVPNRLWVAAGTGPYYADLGSMCLWPVSWKSQARGIEELVATDIVQSSGHAPMFAAMDFGIHIRSDLNAYSTGFGPKERVTIAAQQVAITPANRDFATTNASDTRLGCCAEDGDSILAGFTDDGGANWSKFATLPIPPGTQESDPWHMSFGSIAVSAGSPDNIVWAPGRNRSPFYTLDRGKSWHRVQLAGEALPYTGSFNTIYYNRKNLVADGATSGTFYMLHSGTAPNAALAGLWSTTDGGQNWLKVFEGAVAPNNGGAAKLRSVPGKAGHLFFTSASAGTDQRLRRSLNGGEQWQAIDGVTQVDDIGFGKAAQGASYPAIYISGKVNGAYGIWRSVDNAASWQQLTDFPAGRLDQVTVIAADPDVFGRVYIGYMGSGFIYGETSQCRAAPMPPLAAESCSAVGAAARPAP